MQQKIVLIGPSGMGKSQIFDNLAKRENLQFIEGREPTDKIVGKKSITLGDLQVEFIDTAGKKESSGLLSFDLNGATVVLLVIDHATLLKEDNETSTLSDFLTTYKQNAPRAKLKIVVNKMDTDIIGNPLSDIGIANIKQRCNEKIDTLTSSAKLDFNVAEDIIYYSAKQEAEKIQRGQPLEADPIIAPLLLSFSASYAVGEQHSEDFWDSLWELKLILAGKVFLFILLVVALTVAFGAIGLGLGMAAGAWAGPGAFLTAIAGAFAGAITAWNLAVLIAAPVLGLAVTALSFGLWHRNTPPSLPGRIAADDIGPMLDGSIIVDTTSNPSPYPALKAQYGKVVGDKPENNENMPEKRTNQPETPEIK